MKRAKWFTGSGDDGDTQLLGNRRVPKHHPQPEAYGAVDEASAVLGLVRSVTEDASVNLILHRIQTDLGHIMSELAASPEVVERFRFHGTEAVSWLNEIVDRTGSKTPPPKTFVVPGETYIEALFHQARTVVRRAERHVSRLLADGICSNNHILIYLNRLSTLCFILACRARGAQ